MGYNTCNNCLGPQFSRRIFLLLILLIFRKNTCHENSALIGLAGGPIYWLARSPDLTQLDFFIWGYVNDKVYSERIESLEHLKTRIQQAISSIDTATLSNVWKNINTRTNYVLNEKN